MAVAVAVVVGVVVLYYDLIRGPTLISTLNLTMTLALALTLAYPVNVAFPLYGDRTVGILRGKGQQLEKGWP